MVDRISQGVSRSRSRLRSLGAIAAILPLIVLGACSGSGGGGDGGTSGNVALREVAYGRLVDVYGYQDTDQTIALYEADVPVGTDIQDERPPGSTRSDDEILYDFISANPDSLQARLLIPREIGSPEFEAAFERLGLRLTKVTPGVFGQNTGLVPFTVVPRNAGVVLTFSEKVPVDESFFVEELPDGSLDVKNTEAVQLLEITGDPGDTSLTGDFRVIPTRIVVRDDQILLDPVLLGTEGSRYGVRNNAAGMPTSPNQTGANIRIALALEGPLRMPGLTESDNTFVGSNNTGDRSIIRDLRSGNFEDESFDISRGFIRDTEPPRIVGEMLMFIEEFVFPLSDDSPTQTVLINKNEISHEIDLGDVIRFVSWEDGSAIGSAEVVADPLDDLGQPDVQRVKVVIRRLPALEEVYPEGDPRRERFGRKRWAPDDDRDFPVAIDERLPYLRQFATRAVLVAEYTDSRINPIDGLPYGDEPANFLSFSPAPLPLSTGESSPPNENISPFAEAIIRFTKPVDLDTVRAFDSFFFATRDVLDDDQIFEDFLEPNNIDPEQFSRDKFATPHMIAARIIDEDGSQTSIRLQPTKGFYLDDEMRQADEGQAFDDKRFRYYMHLLGGQVGIRDLAGNALDFQSGVGVRDFLVIPFSLDTRSDVLGRPLFADNLAVSIVRRFAADDEDEQPSLYLEGERASLDPGTGQPINPPAEAYPLQDVFGAVTYLGNGRMQSRLTARVRKVVDDLNQQPPPPQTSDLRFCPTDLDQGGTVATPSASVRFGQGIQNPLNPYGARLQTAWREIDMSLSRVDPLDFNLDVEQMWWAPFQAGAITFDQFDRVSLFLGHSEYRPEPCVGSFSSLPELVNSGLKSRFADNYAHNKAPLTGQKTLDPAPHAAYVDQSLTIDASNTIFEVNGVNRFLPLPTFQKPNFIWRDETVRVQGAASGEGSDVAGPNQDNVPYVISPWLSGNGRFVTLGVGAAYQFNFGRWNNQSEFWIRQNSRADTFTGGGSGTIALPLLADFWTYCDDPDLPEGNGFIATGFNGWQIALAVQSSPRPNFRAYSGGFSGSSSRPPICIDEGSSAWSVAAGGFTPAGGTAGESADNSVYWIMADFLKRQTIVTAGFVDLFNPHRMPGRMPNQGDPRLGPYLIDSGGVSALPPDVLPRYSWTFEPPLERLTVGTSVVPEFRAASEVDPEPWRYSAVRAQLGWTDPPDEVNFPLDPLKACDAQIIKYDDRPTDPVTNTGPSRQHWAYYYNRQVTDYTRDIADLSRDTFTAQFTSPVERFDARDVRYFNWRFIMRNNVDANPPVSPAVDSFAVTYRFERQ